MFNRKNLPCFGYLHNRDVNVKSILKLCEKLDLLDFDKYRDIQYSSASKMSHFVLANSFNKKNFFTEDHQVDLEGECYKQKYLTEIDPEILSSGQQQKQLPETLRNSIFFRKRRLLKSDINYDPISDELSYGHRNDLVQGIFSEILDAFQSKVTRVRLAYLAPNFSIKPHVDYDPSYITRYHIPILTNKDCRMHVIRNNLESSCHFPADGRIYFFNSGLKHWASNNSKFPRLHLIIDTHGQADLQNCLLDFHAAV